MSEPCIASSTRGDLIRFSTLQPQRWANNLGETVELFRADVGGAVGTRLSIATIDRDVPFSPLPGIDRILMALGPEPLVLSIDGARRQIEQFETVTFTGEQTVNAVEVAAIGRDLNLMMRRGDTAPVLELRHVTGTRRINDSIAIVILEGSLSCCHGPLEPFDSVVLRGSYIEISGSGKIAVARSAHRNP
jgi:uncharacterized protein